MVSIACLICGIQHQFSSSSFSVTECQWNVVSYAWHERHVHNFYHVIEEVYPHITAMLDEACEIGKEEK